MKKNATCFFTCLKLHLVLNSIRKGEQRQQQHSTEATEKEQKRTNKLREKKDESFGKSNFDVCCVRQWSLHEANMSRKKHCQLGGSEGSFSFILPSIPNSPLVFASVRQDLCVCFGIRKKIIEESIQSTVKKNIPHSLNEITFFVPVFRYFSKEFISIRSHVFELFQSFVLLFYSNTENASTNICFYFLLLNLFLCAYSVNSSFRLLSKPFVRHFVYQSISIQTIVFNMPSPKLASCVHWIDNSAQCFVYLRQKHFPQSNSANYRMALSIAFSHTKPNNRIPPESKIPFHIFYSSIYLR